jgi:predicted nucleic acid-binding protein
MSCLLWCIYYGYNIAQQQEPTQALSLVHSTYLADARDNFVLELAVASCARYVVTFNTKDFEGVEAHGINAIRPIVFLRILENLP